MEHWHPNPDFFFQPGAGPMLDLGPYYVTNLINLIGPVRRVAAMSSTPSPTRTISSQPRAGEKIPVKTPTNDPCAARIRQRRDHHAWAPAGMSGSTTMRNMELYGDRGHAATCPTRISSAARWS